MTEKAVDTQGHVERASFKGSAAGNDSHVCTASPTLIPPPSTCALNINPTIRTPHWKNTGVTSLSTAKPSQEPSQDLTTFQSGPSQAYIPQTLNTGESRWTDGKRSTSPIPWDDRHNSHTPGLPPSFQASNQYLEKLSIAPQLSHSQRADSPHDHRACVVSMDGNDIAEDDDSKRHAMWILVCAASSPDPSSL